MTEGWVEMYHPVTGDTSSVPQGNFQQIWAPKGWILKPPCPRAFELMKLEDKVGIDPLFRVAVDLGPCSIKGCCQPAYIPIGKQWWWPVACLAAVIIGALIALVVHLVG